MLSVRSVDHIVLNVKDVEVAATWYTRVLGMTRNDRAPTGGGTTRTSVTFGAQKINLRPIATTQDDWFTASEPAVGSADLCFLVEVAPDKVIEHLTSCGVAIEVGPVTKRGARGNIFSVYCRDPDGSLIEIASYPAA